MSAEREIPKQEDFQTIEEFSKALLEFARSSTQTYDIVSDDL